MRMEIRLSDKAETKYRKLILEKESDTSEGTSAKDSTKKASAKQSSNKDSGSSSIKLTSSSDMSTPDSNNMTMRNITMIDKESGVKYEFEGAPKNVKTDVTDVIQFDKNQCPYCLKRYSRFMTTKFHMRRKHNVRTKTKVTFRDHCKCLECNITFRNLTLFRDHLQGEHQMQDLERQKIEFPNMDAFYRWKKEVECKQQEKYCMSRGKKFLQDKTSYLFVCHRSGLYNEKLKGPERKRMRRPCGSVKMGILCTAEMKCEEFPNVVKVEYCLKHYGHGKDMAFRELTEMEQYAIQENVSKGMSYDNLMSDLHEEAISTSFQVGLTKLKDVALLKKAFNAEDLSNVLSDAESITRWVVLCMQMEDSPVLYYRQKDNEILMVIMTEFQKNILLSSDKTIFCVDKAHRDMRHKNTRFQLTCLMVIDDCNMAFPVAFCISDKVDKGVMTQFLECIREAAGQLSCDYFMSDSESFYFEAWKEVMDDNSKWLWCMWFIDGRFRTSMKYLTGKTVKREAHYQKLRLLLECKNRDIFETMLKIFIKDLLEDPEMKKSADLILNKYANSKEFWAYCYHKDVKLSSITAFDVLHRTMRFCCMEGKKIRFDKFIFAIMKLIKHKMLDRLTNVLDEEKISLAVKAINAHHRSGFEIPSVCISSLGDKMWLVKSSDEEGNVTVVREFDSCPEFCSLKCSECEICVHMFSCSCIRNMVYADLCPHIHAVAWKFLTPHLSPSASPAPNNCEEMEDSNKAEPETPTRLFDAVVKMTHDFFKQVHSNKSTLSESTLSAIKDRLNDCMVMSSGKPFKDSELSKHYMQNDSEQNLSNGLEKNSQLNQISKLNSNNVQSPNETNIASQNLIHLQKDSQQNLSIVQGKNSPLNSTDLQLKVSPLHSNKVFVPNITNIASQNPKECCLLQFGTMLPSNTTGQYVLLLPTTEKSTK